MRKFFACSIMLFVFSLPLFAQETFTLTTYYPAPFGVYSELRSRRMAIGDNYFQQSAHPWAATSPNPAPGIQIDQAADLVVEDNVGIATMAPSYSLDIGIDPTLPNTVSWPNASNTPPAAGQGLRISGGYLNVINTDTAQRSGWASIMITGASSAPLGGAELRLHDMNAGPNLRHSILRNQVGRTVFGSVNDNGTWNRQILTMDHATGNVGIGAMASPTEKLEIAGTAGTDGIKYPDGTKQTSARLSCASAQSTWGPVVNHGTYSASCPAGYVGVTGTFEYYDRNAVNGGNGGSVMYHGPNPCTWNADRTTCSVTLNDSGITEGAVYVDCCRIP